MRVLSELEPKNVFSFFEDICNIPHPSYKEEKISNYLVDFAKERKLEYYQDSLNNVIIIKEASKGYEDAAPIILQGHMDMVCEKTPDCDKNMDEDGLDLEVFVSNVPKDKESILNLKQRLTELGGAARESSQRLCKKLSEQEVSKAPDNRASPINLLIDFIVVAFKI